MIKKVFLKLGDPLIPFPGHRGPVGRGVSSTNIGQTKFCAVLFVCRHMCTFTTNTKASPYTEQIFPCQLFGSITARRLVTRAFSCHVILLPLVRSLHREKKGH